ncbi:MAG: hypothetical protein KQJ78_13890 [Deltaproteobacteria bacterium]|nr:hypothetical protein [Deltaproteobacteria bacterium]
MSHAPAPLFLRVPLQMPFLPLTVGFAEQAALALGLGRMEALQLTLATEEVFSYLCRVFRGGEAVELEARGGGFMVQLVFRFPYQDLDLKFFNLTADPSADDTHDLDHLGLLLASRAVDRFFLREGEDQHLVLGLVKEKEYPPGPPQPLTASPLAEFTVQPITNQDLLLVPGLLASYHTHDQYPPRFSAPDRLVDMRLAGDIEGAAARDGQDRLGGVMLWQRRNSRLVRYFGPYLFNQPAGRDLAAALVEHFLAQVARTDAVGVFTLHATPETPSEYFESLGEVPVCLPDRACVIQTCQYRQIQEDPGGVVWAHPRLVPFLEEFYGNLALARQINQVAEITHHQPEHSVLATVFDRPIGLVELKPVWDGQDWSQNLAAHVATLDGEGFTSLMCELDLAQAWQGVLGARLLDLGFVPRVVLPFGGRGDLLILTRAAD